MTSWPTRLANLLAVAAFAGAVALLVAALPLDGLIGALRAWVAGLGFWAPLAYALAYGLATTALVPGSVLSLAAGALFGPWVATAVVWTGATLAIALSFLAARYVARSRVEDWARSSPRFNAVDRAIGEQGWKIVALMRLSPAFPFGLQNYLFGITAIRFWPCCVASAVFILPGTFLYVYVGYAGSEAAAAVSSGGRADWLKLGLQGAGLAATVLVTILVARIASKAAGQHVPVESPAGNGRALKRPDKPTGPVFPWMLAVSLAGLLASIVAFARREAIRDRLFPSRFGQVEICESRGRTRASLELARPRRGAGAGASGSERPVRSGGKPG